MVQHGIQLTHMATSPAISLLSFYTLLKGKICKTTLLSSQQADKQKIPMSPAVCIWNSDKTYSHIPCSSLCSLSNASTCPLALKC